MWISRERGVISERPDEEDMNSDCDGENRLEGNRSPDRKGKHTKIDKILDKHEKEKEGFNFFTKKKGDTAVRTEFISKQSNAKIGSAGKGLKQNVLSNNGFKNGNERNYKTNDMKENNRVSSSSGAIPYRFMNLESFNKEHDEFEEVLVKIEDSKQNNSIDVGKIRNEFIINSKGLSRENRGSNIPSGNPGNNNSIIPGMTDKEREELEKFNSIKSVTNTEKIRQYIRYKEAWNYFSSIDLSEEKAQAVVEDFSKFNCFKKIYLSCTKKLILDPELSDERELVFAIAGVGLNYNDDFHIRIITTIYKTLTGELECPLKGDHWVKIGFQSEDPKADLRSSGIFSMLMVLAFQDKFLFYAKEIYNYSLGTAENNNNNTEHNRNFKEDNSLFPYVLVMINLAKFTIEALREGYLLPYCNKNKSVINTLCDYFFGIVDHFFTVYRNSPIELDFMSTMLNKVNSYAKNNPEKILLLVRHLIKAYPQTIKDSMSLGEDV